MIMKKWVILIINDNDNDNEMIWIINDEKYY